MSKVLCFLIAAILLGGCGHFNRHKSKPASKPYETQQFNNFKSSSKEDAKMFQSIGLGFFQKKDWAEGERYLDKAVKLDPKLYWSWYCLGLVNINSEKGYNCLKKAAELKPDFASAYYWMAYYHCRAREDKKAIAMFEEYIKLAKGKIGEEDRLKAANEALQELLSGKEGKTLVEIRKPLAEDKIK